MFSSRIMLCHVKRCETQHLIISVPKNAWILSVSGLGTPGNHLLCHLNAIQRPFSDKENKEFLLLYHGGDKDIAQDTYERLVFINSFDVEDEAYSVFEVLPPEN